MPSRYQQVKAELAEREHLWLLTGVAGFIGSAVLEQLLSLGQRVIGLDNFSTGKRSNLEDVRGHVAPKQWSKFELIEGDIGDLKTCERACDGVEFVLHQAALGSVPRSLHDPLSTHESNVDGFLKLLLAARGANVRRFLYAASSSTYGDSNALPKREDVIGRPLSPYAVTKLVNELYADVFARCYEMTCVGLRYFNVYGRRQDARGAYAAVIPLWFASLLRGDPVFINGDGESSRDFCHVEDAVQANVLAAVADLPRGSHVFNIAAGRQTSLRELFEIIKSQVVLHKPDAAASAPTHRPFRAGDVRHSLADIGRAREKLGYEPGFDVRSGIQATAQWYSCNSD